MSSHSHNILFLNPFGGQSHAAFQTGWQRHSEHRFQVLSLPAVHWKWRARHASLTFANQANELADRGERFSCVVCTSMLDLASWRGLVRPEIARLPVIAYFHENQYSYPVKDTAVAERDSHLAYSNFLTACCADVVCFNSQFHQDAFLEDAQRWLSRMPDFRHLDVLETIKTKSRVEPPGVDLPGPSMETLPKPPSSPTIGWVMRWEHDKAPDLFVDTVIKLAEEGLTFQLLLLGERFAKEHPSLQRLRRRLGDLIVHDGYAATSEEYHRRLTEIDLVISTAQHEFFGIAIIESILAGAQPLLPNRLAYPETLGLSRSEGRRDFFYDNNADFLPALRDAIHIYTQHGPAEQLRALRLELQRFGWNQRAESLDKLASSVIDGEL